MGIQFSLFTVLLIAQSRKTVNRENCIPMQSFSSF
uniref:Uncharacterized protein n=1 Tax=Anguilla anguilla TaxID=7936 RepID=A0A0E9PYU4_ANGAN